MSQLHRAWGPTPWSHPTLAVPEGRADGSPWRASAAWRCWGLRKGVGDGDTQLGVGFSRAMWHRVGDGSGHPSWHRWHSVRDQGAGHWGLLEMSVRCWGEEPSHFPNLSRCGARAMIQRRPHRASPALSRCLGGRESAQGSAATAR